MDSYIGKRVLVIENSAQTAELYAMHKPLLFGLAYRMLGHVMDAEDIVHEAFLSFNKAETEHVHNIRSYLCKTVTNRCIDHLQSSRKQREVYIGTWLPEPLVSKDDDPFEMYMHKESLSTAYLLLLQQLSYVERAVFLLREALGYDYDEISDIVGKSSTNCRQIFHRAKRSLSMGHVSNKEVPSKMGQSHLVEQFMRALANGDAGELLRILSRDATLFSDGGGKAAAPPRPMRGSDRISVFLAGLPAKVPSGPAFQIAVVNGQPGIIVYANGQTIAVLSFKMEDSRVTELYMVANPDKLKHVK